MAIRLLADISTFSHHKCTAVHRAKNQYLYLGDFCKTVCVRRASPNSYHSVVYINYEYLFCGSEACLTRKTRIAHFLDYVVVRALLATPEK